MPCPINHKILSLIKGVEPIPLKKSLEMSLQRESKVSELQGFRRGHVYISYYYFVDIRSYLSKCPRLLRELSIFLAALYSES